MTGLVRAAHARNADHGEGVVADYIPILAKADPRWFGLSLVGVNGRTYEVGDTTVSFSIQSISKAFVFALVFEELGHEEVRRRVGVNNTGLAFNSVMAIELNDGSPLNSMVNAGALATTALVCGETAVERWENIRMGLSRFAGHPLELDGDVYRSEARTNHRNRAIALLLQSYDRLEADPLETVDVMITLGIAVAVFLLSFRLRSDRGGPGVTIDAVASVLIGAAIVALTLGFNNLNGWGLLRAKQDAPFSVVGLSPAPILIVLGQCFFLWTRRRTRRGEVPLVDLSVLSRPSERAAVYAMFTIVAMEAAVNFSVPTYIQIVQGRTPFDTSLAMMSFNLTVFVTATLIVRFYKRHTPRTIALFAFGLTTVSLIWLAVVVTNTWETLPTILGLILFGVGQGSLVTLVFNVLVTAVPKSLAGDVGSIRGTTQNLASALGTAVLVTVLSLGVTQAVDEHPELPPELAAQVDLDTVNFVSNEDLREVLAETTATPEQIEAAVALNEEARLSTLRIGFLILAGSASWRRSRLRGCPATVRERFRIRSPGQTTGDDGEGRSHLVPLHDAEVGRHLGEVGRVGVRVARAADQQARTLMERGQSPGGLPQPALRLLDGRLDPHADAQRPAGAEMRLQQFGRVEGRGRLEGLTRLLERGDPVDPVRPRLVDLH